ncbi:hypothetical protein AAEX28_10115 [Lentisphaerota bacterium WC36G]|nr:hypothetical protein LJT99_12950 [Lentisphaerae bacterium WC36]
MERQKEAKKEDSQEDQSDNDEDIEDNEENDEENDEERVKIERYFPPKKIKTRKTISGETIDREMAEEIKNIEDLNYDMKRGVDSKLNEAMKKSE